MKRWKNYAAGLLLTAGLSSQVRAQAVVPVSPAAAPAAAPASNLWSFLCLTPEQKAACKDKLCNSALGQMLNNGLKPMSALSGGLIPSLCPTVTAADLAKPADSPEGAAARAKADEADAKERRAAVRFLGTVDCHYWPEAQEALVNALRGDRNECVRLEAAFALNRGCCCTKMIIKALVVCVSGSDEDGFPTERSERVRATAHAALEHCLACYTEVVALAPEVKDGGKEPIPTPKEPVPVPRGEAKPSGTPDKLPATISQQQTPADYYARVQTVPRQKIIEESQRLLTRAQSMPTPAMTMPMPQESSPTSLVEIFQHAFSGTTSTPSTIVVMPPTPPMPMRTVSTQALFDPLPPAKMETAKSEAAKIDAMNTGVVKTDVVKTEPKKIDVVKTDVVKTEPKKIEPVAPVIVPAPAVAKTDVVKTEPKKIEPVVPAFAPAPVMVAPVVEKTPLVVQAAPIMPAPTPAPVATRPTQVAWNQPTPTTPVQPVQMMEKPAPARQPAAPTSNGMNMTMAQVVDLLRESPYPEYRGWAADNLSTVDGWTNPDVLQSLAQGARKDMNATVRATCVRSLGRMRCGTMTVLSAVQSAKGDPDPRVRQEADLALQLIGSTEGGGLALPSGR